MDRMTGCRLGNADTQHVIARRRHIGWSEAGTRAPLAPKDDQLNPAAAVAPECRSFNQPSAQWSRGMVACLHPSSSRRDGEISLQTAHRIEEGVWRGLAPEGTCYRRQLTAAENSGLAWSSDPSGVRDGGRRGRSEAPQGVGPFVSAAQTRLPWASPAVRLAAPPCRDRFGRTAPFRASPSPAEQQSRAEQSKAGQGRGREKERAQWDRERKDRGRERGCQMPRSPLVPARCAPECGWISWLARAGCSAGAASAVDY
jgi:hypothetical protein